VVDGNEPINLTDKHYPMVSLDPDAIPQDHVFPRCTNLLVLNFFKFGPFHVSIGSEGMLEVVAFDDYNKKLLDYGQCVSILPVE
jgi:hypothetical protein